MTFKGEITKTVMTTGEEVMFHHSSTQRSHGPKYRHKAVSDRYTGTGSISRTDSDHGGDITLLLLSLDGVS